MKFQVNDMTCQHCVKSITAAIEAIDAVAQVHCDVAQHEVSVTSTQSENAVKQAIIDAGYTVS